MMPASRAPVYDRIGGRYAAGRRTDPRIAAPIWTALGGAWTVLNVGAGGGSYEPRGPRVVAVEPSVVMIAQRPLDAAPAVPGDCTDGFNGAYWQRPRAVLDPAVWGPMSALSLIPAADRAAGMGRLRADLDSGAWHRRFGHLLGLADLDLGYCVVVTR